MAELEKANSYRWKNSWSQPLAMADAVTKLLIEKGVITEAEFKQSSWKSVRVSAHSKPNDTVITEPYAGLY